MAKGCLNRRVRILAIRVGRYVRKTAVPHCVFCLQLILLLGCDRERSNIMFRTLDSAEQGTIVARVNGVAIHAEDVRRSGIRNGESPAEAMSRLIEFELLAQSAAAQGYDQRPEIATAARRAAVQYLLRRYVENGRAPEQIPLAEVESLYRTKRSSFHRPERRVVRELRFGFDDLELSRETAYAIAEQAHQEMNAATSMRDVQQVVDRFREKGTVFVHGPVEQERGPLPPELASAVFAADIRGPLQEIVASDSAFHVAYLDQILLEETTPFSRVEMGLRRRMSLERRSEVAKELIAQTAQRFEVQRFQDAVDQAIHSLRTQ